MANQDPVDEEYEKLKKRRLDVVGAGPSSSPDEPEPHLLEGEGLGPPVDAVDPAILRDRIVQTLKTIYDPEIPLNIYELGLIYDLDVDQNGNVYVKMTLTAPACPVAGELVQEVHDRTRTVPGVRRAKTELVWDPPWTRDRLSMEAQLELCLL
jgi:FeS assembly SUF system protein